MRTGTGRQNPLLLAIDQGTSSSRAIVFDRQGLPVTVSQQEFPQHFLRNGWVEHDPEDIWSSVLKVFESVTSRLGSQAADIVAIGITNQRETTLIWDRVTGHAIHNAIVWQDRRTAQMCEKLSNTKLDSMVQERTGLRLDPYFSATKIRWLLDNVPGARRRAEQGELAFGTVDSFLVWRLTGGRSHKTDASNASRTMLFDIHRQCWDQDILAAFDIPPGILPEVLDSADDFGVITEGLPCAGIPISGVAGDQQAALIGQACFEPGMTKSTYGTGCFMICNTGSQIIKSDSNLLSTVAYRLQGETTFALEGSIFDAGSTVQWLRDGLNLVSHAAETEQHALKCGVIEDVFLVPAFTGLGAPHWDPHARGALFGLNRNTGIGEIVTATLQSVGFQSRDLLLAMEQDGADISRLRVDGGMIANNWLCQFLADMLDRPVERPKVTESTAFGAACLAGLQSAVFGSLDQIQSAWRCETEFVPTMQTEQRIKIYAGWLDAVKRVRSGT